jgi:hypothetical protein
MRSWVPHGDNPLALRAAKPASGARRLRRRVRTLRDTPRWAWRASNRVR